MNSSLISITGILGLATSLVLADPLPPKDKNKPFIKKKTQSARTDTLSAEDQLKGFKLPEGYVIELVASEEHGVINPIDISFDDAGRLWTQTASMYPLDPVKNIPWNKLLKLMDNPAEQDKNPDFKRIKDLYQLKTKGADKILILDDLSKPASKPLRVWADGLTIPQSILPYKDGAYVCHGSELFLLRDTDGDGKSDKMEPVLTGFGFTDTHTMAHTLVRAPGGYVHFSQGALNKGEIKAVNSGDNIRIDYSKIVRFSHDKQRVELVNSGLNNIWGVQLQAKGQWYLTEANDFGFSVNPAEPQTGFRGIGNAKLRPYQPLIPVNHKFRVGASGISGLEFMEDTSGSFPAEDWQDIALLANPITSTINAVKITRLPNGEISAVHLEDFLSSEDDWFRPVNIEFGPDGCLYIADWYNKIVSHNEVGTSHPDRDKTHGRIWRIRHKSQQPREIPNLIKSPTLQLVEHLKSASLWETRAAWHQIADRPHSESDKLKLTSSLIELAKDQSQTVTTRIHALWSLESLRHFDHSTVTALLSDKDTDLVRETIRTLSSFKLTPATVNTLIADKLKHSNPMIRSQVLRTLTSIKAADKNTIATLISACKPALKGNALGGSYERNFERFLARKSLEQYPAELSAYFKSPESDNSPVENKLWALQALPSEQKKAAFLSVWQQVAAKKLDNETFIAIANMLTDQDIYAAVKQNFSDPKNATMYVKLAIKHLSRVQSPPLVKVLTPAISSLLDEPKTLELGLNAVHQLKVNGLHAKIAKIDSKNEKTLNLLLAVYSLQPQHYVGNLLSIINKGNHTRDIRLDALASYIKPHRNDGAAILEKIISSTPADQHQEITEKFSQSKQGSSLLLEMYAQKKLTSKAFSLSAAERIKTSARKNPVAKELDQVVRKSKADEKNLKQGKIKQFLAASKKLKGDANAGKLTFQSCMMCHKVGNEGQEIAPVLDGSAHRDTAHLLTAIVDPDQAVEGGYGLYRVTKKDGSSTEGFLVKKDSKGVTTAMMGGSKIFTPVAEIARSSFVGGRSFMPDMFGNLSDQQMVDLLEYIKTLK
ncbi:MAG: putative heme-binding domain-containing protein [Cryomorphaceae bacterium]|jgi:putative heme-binding domain-containing protein